MAVKAQQGEIKLGQTSGFRYIGFQPPLTPEQYALLEEVPTPNEEKPILFSSGGLQEPSDGSMEIALHTEAFEVSGEITDSHNAFRDYAQRVAQQVGGYTLVDTTIYHLGPGVSVFQVADGAEPQW